MTKDIFTSFIPELPRLRGPFHGHLQMKHAARNHQDRSREWQHERTTRTEILGTQIPETCSNQKDDSLWAEDQKPTVQFAIWLFPRVILFPTIESHRSNRQMVQDEGNHSHMDRRRERGQPAHESMAIYVPDLPKLILRRALANVLASRPVGGLRIPT